ncbi:MAG: (5-formylfuran-3-yl)methyl phosphate synthase [Gemmatimonadota bacterium]
MRLLVSVRDADEARLAEAGGAAIIDAKEPSRGPLGQVDAEVLAAIRNAVSPRRWVSAALGDVASTEDVARAFAAVAVPVRFVKLGFRGVTDTRRIERLLFDAVRRADSHVGRPRVVAVAYGDYARVETVPPVALRKIAQASGIGGLLIDTCVKDGLSLFDFMEPASLNDIGSALAADELEFALAGNLRVDRVASALKVGATIFGVRGAVCESNRRTDGIVEGRVRELAESIRHELSRP